MKELVITAWCDLCWLDDQTKTPSALQLRISISAGMRDGTVKEMEFCEAHAADLTALREAYQQASDGAEATPAAARPEYEPPPPVECPICGVQHVGRTQTISHIRRTHRAGEDIYPEPWICEYCDRTDFSTPQGYALHLRSHGVDLVARAAEPVLARQKLAAERKRRKPA